jgi:hypothetical protein
MSFTFTDTFNDPPRSNSNDQRIDIESADDNSNESLPIMAFAMIRIEEIKIKMIIFERKKKKVHFNFIFEFPRNFDGFFVVNSICSVPLAICFFDFADELQ